MPPAGDPGPDSLIGLQHRSYLCRPPSAGTDLLTALGGGEGMLQAYKPGKAETTLSYGIM